MELKKDNQGLGKNILFVLLIIFLGLAISYIGYLKFLEKDSTNNDLNNEEKDNSQDNSTDEDDNLDELRKLNNMQFYDDLGFNIYFEDYISNIPVHYVNDKATSYKVSDLTDEEISMFVWRYIWSLKANIKPELDDSTINSLVKSYLNLDNYKVKELEFSIEENKPWNIFELKHENGKYIASVYPTEFSFLNYRVKDVKYNSKDKEISVFFDSYVDSMGISKMGEGIVILKVHQDCDTCGGNNFYIEKVEYKIVER